MMMMRESTNKTSSARAMAIVIFSKSARACRECKDARASEKKQKESKP